MDRKGLALNFLWCDNLVSCFHLFIVTFKYIYQNEMGMVSLYPLGIGLQAEESFPMAR